VVTQVVVDEADEAFENPMKPVGLFYSHEEAERLATERGYRMIEDSGRGYRRVVASPKPVDVVEKDVVRSLVKDGHVVITVGGGGIPVVKRGQAYESVQAVIDKDFATCKMAEILDADYFFVLTAVDRVSIHYGTPDQVDLESMSTAQARQYIGENHFAPGSMLPKIEAAIAFAESKPGRKAVIASLENAKAALSGESGTVVHGGE
jgi:carbamate kinase